MDLGRLCQAGCRHGGEVGLSSERLGKLRRAYRAIGRGETEWADGTPEGRRVGAVVRARLESRRARQAVFVSFAFNNPSQAQLPEAYRYGASRVRFATMHLDTSLANVMWAKGNSVQIKLTASARWQLATSAEPGGYALAKSAAPTQHAPHAMALQS